MLYNTTTYYRIQATTENFTNPTETLRGRPRPAPGRERVGGEKQRRKPVEAFSGVGRRSPRPRPVPCVLGRSWAAGARWHALGPASSFLAMGDPCLAAVIVGSGEAGQARRPGRRCRPSLLAFNLLSSRQRQRSRLGTNLGKPLFPAKPAFLGLRAAAALNVRAGAVALHRRGRGRAFGKQPGRRPAI